MCFGTGVEVEVEAAVFVDAEFEAEVAAEC